jgi:hypothetical protein
VREKKVVWGTQDRGFVVTAAVYLSAMKNYCQLPGLVQLESSNGLYMIGSKEEEGEERISSHRDKNIC